ncbi:TerB family tellurite resistance protein [Lentilitoribacter sp. EG35]|uniref:tellurite resistance TerB family protein n=1 Tax=Lentilitoribacter sp. EG35 TaxID=3234192 RepID=UPI0034602F1E
MLIDKLRDFISSLTDDSEQFQGANKDDPQVAAAALFYRVIEADGVISESEQVKLKELLAIEFDISMDEAILLYHAGEAADQASVDFYTFTRVLKKHLTTEQKICLVEILWELAYADGERHELEDHVIWRISDLMGISGRERVLARQRVEEELRRS